MGLRRLGLGRIRLRAAGSDAGHNGIRSIIQAVGGTGFPRLRIGIGAPPAGLIAREYVLEKFSDQESEAINEAVNRAASAVQSLLSEGIDAAMNRYNQDPAAALDTSEPEKPSPRSRAPGAGRAADVSPDRSARHAESEASSDEGGQ